MKVQLFLQFLNQTYETLIVNPLWQLYRCGPNVSGIGFWYGRPFSEICQILTNHKQSFWEKHPEECEGMVRSRFESFRKSLEITLYFFCLCRALYLILTEIFFKVKGRWEPQKQDPNGYQRVPYVPFHQLPPCQTNYVVLLPFDPGFTNDQGQADNVDNKKPKNS